MLSKFSVKGQILMMVHASSSSIIVTVMRVERDFVAPYSFQRSAELSWSSDLRLSCPRHTSHHGSGIGLTRVSDAAYHNRHTLRFCENTFTLTILLWVEGGRRPRIVSCCCAGSLRGLGI